MSKIITVTANTAIDYVVRVDHLILGETVQAESGVEFAAGKGLNVAKAVESLSRNVHALGFVGRSSHRFFNDLKSELLHVDLIPLEGKTRTNITLVDNAAKRETHIRTSGYSVTEPECRKLIDKIDTYVWKGDVVVLSGSLPSGAVPDLYARIIERCRKKSAIVLLDSSGDSLRQGAAAKPFLIKPNQQELEEFVGRSLPNETAIVDAARAMAADGTQMVAVSRGENGVVAYFDRSAYALAGTIEFADIVSSVGCGDAMLAGLAIAIAEQNSLEQALRFGTACGCANLFTREPGRLDPERVTAIEKTIVVREIR
ncbi:MAG: 1-phosphofructokinase family hexose kinase [Gammaproteobacteria bacterium]